ncbi:MAG TPA: DNA-processing protein DprA [Agromyces sp.]|nr:DNA-processing protein DprA [Agromyces sp.]
MSILARSVADLGAELAAVRQRRPDPGGSVRSSDDPDAASEALSRAVLGSVAEPGDGVLGRAVAAVGAPRVAELLLSSATPAILVEAVQEAGEHLDEREATAGLERWRPRLDHPGFVRSLAQAARVGARLVIPSDPEWPVGLDELGLHAPLALWIRGHAGALAGAMPAVALVGARAATGYGEHVTMESASGLVDRGFAVVSGGAYGIDGMAHRSALASGGTTVAFLAGGVDRFYPMGHEALLTRIVQTGAVISELPCGAAPTKWRFLQRNRLIAAASAATVVLEAGIRSGSLNTAGHAAELGRPLGAVPGPVTSPASAGCHRLLREYDAVCVVDAEQMAELAGGRSTRPRREERDGVLPRGGVRPGQGEQAPAVAPSAEALRVMDALSTRTVRELEDLVRRSGMEAGAVMAVLGVLEIHGIAERRRGGWIRRRGR